jgi:hypothetical protein
MSNKQNLGYDGIKRMLNTMRTLNENTASKATLKEEEEEKVNNLVLNNNVEIKVHSADQEDLNISDEEKNALNQLIENFKTQVSEIATFEEGFNIYTNSIRLDGSISEDLGFVFIAGEDRGIYINSDMLMLNDETTVIIEKLNKFQHTFEDVVNEMMNTRKTN